MATASLSPGVSVNLRVLLGYSDATACVVTSQPFVTVASEYPHSILNGTGTCSSHSGTGYYETHVAGQGESGCVENTRLRFLYVPAGPVMEK